MRRARPITGRFIVGSALAALLLVAMLAARPATVGAEEVPPRPQEFVNGFPTEAKFFPLGVWLQQPRNAAAYSAMGINTYVGLWQQPAEAQLEQLEQYGLYLIAEHARRPLAAQRSRDPRLAAGGRARQRAAERAWRLRRLHPAR